MATIVYRWGTFDITILVDGQVKDSMKGVHPTPGTPATINFDLKNRPAGRRHCRRWSHIRAEKAMTKEQKEALGKANKGAKNKSRSARTERLYAARREALEKYEDSTTPRSKPLQPNKAAMLDPDGHRRRTWSPAILTSGPSSRKTGADATALYDKGFDAFRKAIALKPDDPAYDNNFLPSLAKGDAKIDEAKANLDKAIQLDPPGQEKYYYNMGALLVEWFAAECGSAKQFKKAIDADPTYAGCPRSVAASWSHDVQGHDR